MPSRLAGETVWVRRRGEEVIITHVGVDGPVEVARHQVTTPGNPRVDAAHFPPAPEGPLNRTPVAANAAEAEFLAIGDGAVLWLKEAGAAGASRVRAKMADAVAMAKLSGVEAVNWALGHAAVYGRFAEADLASILAHGPAPPPATAARPVRTTACSQAPTPGRGSGDERAGDHHRHLRQPLRGARRRARRLGVAARPARGLARHAGHDTVEDWAEFAGPGGIRLEHVTYVLGHWSRHARPRRWPAGPVA